MRVERKGRAHRKTMIHVVLRNANQQVLNLSPGSLTGPEAHRLTLSRSPYLKQHPKALQLTSSYANPTSSKHRLTAVGTSSRRSLKGTQFNHRHPLPGAHLRTSSHAICPVAGDAISPAHGGPARWVDVLHAASLAEQIQPDFAD